MGASTLPAGSTGGCSMSTGCSDGGSGSSGMRPVDVETGNQPIIFDDSNNNEEVSAGEGNSGYNPGEGGDGNSGYNPGDNDYQ